eukprot:scaffold23765_cov35-Cyclotella_meneghiniana.AAC.3
MKSTVKCSAAVTIGGKLGSRGVAEGQVLMNNFAMGTVARKILHGLEMVLVCLSHGCWLACRSGGYFFEFAQNILGG